MFSYIFHYENISRKYQQVLIVRFLQWALFISRHSPCLVFTVHAWRVQDIWFTYSDLNPSMFWMYAPWRNVSSVVKSPLFGLSCLKVYSKYSANLSWPGDWDWHSQYVASHRYNITGRRKGSHSHSANKSLVYSSDPKLSFEQNLLITTRWNISST